MTRRADRVGDVLREELNRLVLREIRDPRVGMATVSRVEMSADLRHARVYVSTLGSEEERVACVAALAHAGGFLRTRLASSLRLRYTPELLFELDRGAEQSLRIATLLKDIDAEPS